MNGREDAFKAKFTDASRHLGITTDQIVSLKIRETVGSYQDYRKLLDFLEHETGLRCSPVDGNLQGHGYIIAANKTKVILVEHETGLELLYILGSIASLVGIIPLILQSWSFIRGHIGNSRPRDFQNIEIRRLDEKGNLSEDRVNGLAAPWSTPVSIINVAVTSAAEIIDCEIQRLRTEVRTLGERVAALEKGGNRKGQGPRAKTLKKDP